MKRKITQRYMIVFTVSVLLIIVLWVGLTYIAVFANQDADKLNPKHLANIFEKYVDQNNYFISDAGKEILTENGLWAQVIDNHGMVLDSFNTPQKTPSKYDVLDIGYYIMKSDALKGQTLFLVSFKNKTHGIIIGCDATMVSKYSLQIYGGTRQSVIKSGILLVIIFTLIGIFAGLIFSKTFSLPVQEIIADINRLEAEDLLESRIYKKNLFSSVYESLNKLQLRLKSADLERIQVERQKNEWIRNISHDMKTPLSSIKGYAELMTEENYEITNDERKQFLDIIIKNSENIDNLVQDLKFNRLSEDGTLVLNKEEININTLIKECCDELPAEYQTEKIIYNFERSILYADVDRHMIKRCFTNLIGNAFIHNNGDVKVSIESYEDERNIIIKISDNGKGMSKEDTDKIFERYYRGIESKRSAGSGLGLAIVKEIVEAHNGEITVQSEEGKGTTFILKL